MRWTIALLAGQGVTALGFVINAGLNDDWYNPATSGRGFFITVFPNIGKMFVAWFTYDLERPDLSVTAQLDRVRKNMDSGSASAVDPRRAVLCRKPDPWPNPIH